MLSLSFFGSFQCVLNGAVLTGFRSIKNQVLLAYLALDAERPHARATLTGLLWPDEDEAHARLNLRQALFQLRSVLHGDSAGEGYLRTTTQTAQFNSASVHTIDVVEFARLIDSCERHPHAGPDRCDACAERFAQAVHLYHGEFLQGLYVDDSSALEEWILWRRQQFQQQMLGALYTLTSWCEQRGDYDRAVHFAQRQIELNSLNEEAYQQLMRVLAQMGRRQEALNQYERCRRLLIQELDVVPSEGTQRLYYEIKQGHFPSNIVNGDIGSQGEGQAGSEESVQYILPPPPPVQHNLPPAPNRFVGRQHELTTLHKQLLNPACRLITVLGPGGVGKTRLVLTLAEQIRDWRLEIGDSAFSNLQSPISNLQFPDGIWFTPLAGISHVLQLPQAIANSLGLRSDGRIGLRQELLDYLHSKSLLLVLDNYEHLLTDAQLVDEILMAAPAVKLIVTSRERLNFQKEWIFELGGLPFQAAARSGQTPMLEAPIPSVGNPCDEGALCLFLERVQRIGPFDATSENLTHAQRICQLVEGYPLGLELAAALVSIMPVGEIVDEIEQGIDILAISMSDIPDRHRSLRAVFDSSWDALRPQERMVFARLSVFYGGFNWRAAQAVAQSTRLDLAGLLGKSMLTLAPGGRYQLHELLRQYGASKLATIATTQVDALYRAHARYFANFVFAHKEQLKAGQQKLALLAISTEIENIRAGWTWAAKQADAVILQQFCRGLALYFETQGLLEEGESAFAQAVLALNPVASAQARLTLIRLMVQMGRFARLRSNYEQAKTVLQRALVLIEDSFEPAQSHRLTFDSEVVQALKAQQAEALHNSGLVAHYLGDNRLAQKQLVEGIDLSRSLDQPWVLAEGLNFLALVTQFVGQPTSAQQYFKESLAIRRNLHDLRGLAITLNQFGFHYSNQADYPRSELMLQESLAIQRDLGDLLGVANTLNSLGASATSQGDYAAAIQYHLESLQIYKQYNDRGGIARNLGNLGYVYNRTGDYQAALEMSTQALVMDRMVGSPHSMVFTLRHLGETYLHLHNLPESRRTYHQALVTALDIGEIPLALLVLNAMAPLWIAEGDLHSTVERLSFILQHPATEGKVQAQARRQLAELTPQLEPASLNVAVEHGKTLTLEEVVQKVLRVD